MVKNIFIIPRNVYRTRFVYQNKIFSISLFFDRNEQAAIKRNSALFQIKRNRSRRGSCWAGDCRAGGRGSNRPSRNNPAAQLRNSRGKRTEKWIKRVQEADRFGQRRTRSDRNSVRRNPVVGRGRDRRRQQLMRTAIFGGTRSQTQTRSLSINETELNTTTLSLSYCALWAKTQTATVIFPGKARTRRLSSGKNRIIFRTRTSPRFSSLFFNYSFYSSHIQSLSQAWRGKTFSHSHRGRHSSRFRRKNYSFPTPRRGGSRTTPWKTG